MSEDSDLTINTYVCSNCGKQYDNVQTECPKCGKRRDKQEMSFVADAKWKCKRCGVVIPYNPTYDMSNKMCGSCQAYYYADKYLKGYRSK